MKSEFKVKFLQHINEKNQDKGFTLIELLVVVIIIGILAAIALPSLLSQTNKAKQAEARQNVGAVNRSQQAYFLEKGVFAANAGDLGVGIKTQTTNFIYTFSGGELAQVTAKGNNPTLKTYLGGVATQSAAAGAGTSEVLTLAVICESGNPNQAGVALTNPNITDTTCPANYVVLGQ